MLKKQSFIINKECSRLKVITSPVSAYKVKTRN